MKICVAKNDLPKEMKLMEINKYLEICLKPDPTLLYCEETNKIKISIDGLDWGEFFYIFDIKFDHKKATKKQSFFNEIYTPIFGKEKVLLANGISIF